MRADLEWWLSHIEPWDGWAFMNLSDWVALADLLIATDACKTGQGGENKSTGSWFAALWSSSELAEAWVNHAVSMPRMELQALVTAARLWGVQWHGLRIVFHCDCAPVVHAVNKGHSKSPLMCALLRELASLAIAHNFVCRAVHIPGVSNVHADLLSRDRVQEFLRVSGRSMGSRTFIPGQQPPTGDRIAASQSLAASTNKSYLSAAIRRSARGWASPRCIPSRTTC